MSTINIRSKDGQTIKVSTELRNMSKLIEETIADHADEQTYEIECNQSAVNIKTIVEYAEHYNFSKRVTDIVHPLVSCKPEEFIKDQWERNFILRLDLNQQVELLEAANYFDVPSVYELCCAMIASKFKGKEFNQIKNEFGLNDVVYTPESEEQIKRDFPWIIAETDQKIKDLTSQVNKKVN